MIIVVITDAELLTVDSRFIQISVYRNNYLVVFSCIHVTDRILAKFVTAESWQIYNSVP